MAFALTVQQLEKSFGDVRAVDGLDLDVPEGTCVGLLGPNGAGKSTTMRMLTGQTLPDSGSIEALGWRLPGESKQARAQMGVVPQLDNLDTTLTARDNLRIFAQLYRVPKADREAAVDRGLQIARLTGRADARADALSGGMRRRLLIARALLHHPRLLLLDEPTVGLDPQVRQELWAMIDALRSEGTSILMTTHYIEEAERLADSVTIVAAGKAVDTGPPAELVARHAGREVREVYGPPDRLNVVEAEARALGFATRRTGTSVAILGAEGAGDRLPEGETRAARLEDVFVKLTGEEVS
ncbi:MAG: transporter related protein [Solirubrobacterales bacterium]|nr:transporter related protein [Solirubrobacterales bacterium]